MYMKSYVASKLRWIGVVACFVFLASAGDNLAQQPSEMSAAAKEPFEKGLSATKEQGSVPALQQDWKYEGLPSSDE